MKPLVKWAGGKTQLLPHLLPLFDENRRYIEPFVGGGALLFSMMPKESVINDSNKELIGTYRAVRDNPHEVFEALRRHRNEKEYYLELRATQPTELSAVEGAARFIYLNKTCFNGLYRVNKRNEFNVPYGNYKNPSIPSLSSLIEYAKVLDAVGIYDEDYKQFLQTVVREGDQIFMDPPYDPVSKYSDFTRYTPGKFGIDDQREVAEIARSLRNRGAKVVITNSDTELIRDLYHDFEIVALDVRRSINRNADGRKGKELLITGEPC